MGSSGAPCASLPDAGLQSWVCQGGAMARGQDPAHSCVGGNPPGCSSLAGRAQVIAGFVLGPKWSGQLGKSWWVSPSSGVFGHPRGVTEITLGIRAVPTAVPQICMDGDGHPQPQPASLGEEEPPADSGAGLWHGCWHFGCEFRWPSVKFMYAA